MLTIPLLAGCSSGPVKVGPRPPVSPTLLGLANGSGCGLLLFQIVPIGVNDRVRAAYAALKVSAGDRAVTDTKVVERWYWIPVVGTVLCTDLEERLIQ